MSLLKIKDLSPDDRPREKMINKGATALTDAELIAILLRSGTRSETVVEVAQRVLALSGNNLNELGRIERTQLQKIKGIGAAKAVTLLAALELGRRRAAAEATPRVAVRTADAVVRLMSPLLADLPHEEMWLLLLNRANRVIERVKISQGGIHATAADTRIILKQALEKLASGIILVHNHPSGNVQPSAEDLRLTKQVQQAAALLDIKFFDHIIIAGNNFYSFTEHAATEN
ncbi:MAG: DNA repair protein RadC [Prevotellaceae bacterium]|jgi:DNA repair protein RadC|nr:DNA repair protein RadC [Prevotellaceae bacterium]